MADPNPRLPLYTPVFREPSVQRCWRCGLPVTSPSHGGFVCRGSPGALGRDPLEERERL
jgi:hypothetical protein